MADIPHVLSADDVVFPPVTFDELIFVRLWSSTPEVAGAPDADDYSTGRWLAAQERRLPWFGPDDVL